MPVRDVIEILIKADGARAIKELDKVGVAARRDLGGAEQSAKRMSAQFTRAGVGMVGAASVLGIGLFKAAQAASAAQIEHEKLANTIRNMPQLAGASVAAFEKQQKAIEGLTVVDDEAVAGIQSLLGQFKLTQTQIIAVTPLVVDLSRKMGIDTTAAAKAVGKAVDGSSGALKKLGINIKLAKDPAERFDQVMKGLSHRVGGFAQTEGKTFSGQLTILKNQLHDIEEGVGVGVVGAFSKALGPITTVSKALAGLDQDTQATIGSIAAIGTAALGTVGALSLVAGQAAKLKERFTVPAELGGGLNNFGKAAVGAGVAAGLLGAAYIAFSEDADAARRRVDELTGAVKNSGKTLGQVAAQQTAEFLAKNREVSGVLRAAGVSVKDYNDAIQHGGKAYDDTKHKLDAYFHSLDRGGPSALNAQRNTLIATQTLDKQRSAFVESRRQIDATNAAQNQLTGTQLDGTKAAKDIGSANTALAATHRALTTSLDKTTTGEKQLAVGAALVGKTLEQQTTIIDQQLAKWDEYRNKQRAAALGALDVADAQQTVKDRLKDVTAAVHDHGAKSDEAKQAIRDYERAVLDLRGTSDDAAKSIYELAKKQAGFKDKVSATPSELHKLLTSLKQQRDALAPDSPLRERLQAYIVQLGKIPRKITTDLTIIGGKVVPRPKKGDSSDTPGRAVGGPVTKGRPYIVGEFRPELFEAPSDGRIRPTVSAAVARPAPAPRALTAPRGVTGGMTTMTYNHYITVTNADPQAVIDAIRVYERRNGKTWRAA